MVRVSRFKRNVCVSAVAIGLLSLAACNADDVLRPSVDVAPAPLAVVPATGIVDEVRTAAYLPRGINPLAGGEPRDVMPESEIACRKKLKKLRVSFEDIPAINDGGQCGVAWPVRLTHVGGVELRNGATLNCTMAETFSRWVRKELVPSARLRYLSGVSAINIASSYSCRWIKGRVGGTISEHAKGNAIDIGSIKLDNGRFIDVRKPGFFAFRQKSLLKKTRTEACDYFTTVLGPGYDRAHRDHFHFDLKQRRNGYVACK